MIVIKRNHSFLFSSSRCGVISIQVPIVSAIWSVSTALLSTAIAREVVLTFCFEIVPKTRSVINGIVVVLLISAAISHWKTSRTFIPISGSISISINIVLISSRITSASTHSVIPIAVVVIVCKVSATSVLTSVQVFVLIGIHKVVVILIIVLHS